MTSDPWAAIGHPDTGSTLTARRADPDHPWGFYWGRDFQRRRLILLEFSASSRGNRALPNLRGIEVIERNIDDTERHQLLVTLKEDSNSDIFYRLCLDLLDASRNCENEEAAVATTISRLWRWQQLLKQGRSDNLTEAEQRGLIGELCFIRDMLLNIFDAHSAISFWEGPVRGEGQKDFSIGSCGVEIKTRLASARSRVRISSEEQLDMGAYKDLLLIVFELSVGSPEQLKSFNVSELVNEIRGLLGSNGNAAIDLFEDRLASTGYRDMHDYSNNNFIVLGSNHYDVTSDFPRLVPSALPAGVLDVMYSIDLANCEHFKISQDDLSVRLKGK